MDNFIFHKMRLHLKLSFTSTVYNVDKAFLIFVVLQCLKYWKPQFEKTEK